MRALPIKDDIYPEWIDCGIKDATEMRKPVNPFDGGTKI